MKLPRRPVHRSLLASSAIALNALACAAGPRHPPPADDGWSDTPTHRPSSPPRHWPNVGRLGALRLVAHQQTAHFEGTAEADVLADVDAGVYPRTGPNTGAEQGAILAERLALGSAAVFFVMQKRETNFNPAGCDWEYLTITPEGLVIDEGNGSLCARCHAEAPHHCVFGLGHGAAP